MSCVNKRPHKEKTTQKKKRTRGGGGGYNGGGGGEETKKVEMGRKWAIGMKSSRKQLKVSRGEENGANDRMKQEGKE